jgi:hypothetical protein
MNKQDIIKKHMSQVYGQGFWFGAALGLVFWIILGMVIGYDLGGDTTIVIPLSEGIKV